MPLDDLAEPLLRGLFRIVAEFVMEVLVRGTGYLLIKYGWYLGRDEPDRYGTPVAIVGLLFWALVLFGGVSLFRGFG